MQVYGLITNGEEFIIPKKAEKNSFWGGQQHHKDTIVNQAGQYACFGGKHEKGDKDHVATILREIHEETGVDIKDLIIDMKDYSKSGYVYFIIKVPEDKFGKLVAEIQKNIKEGNVSDGEFQEAHIVPIKYLDLYLGKREDVKLTQSDLASTKQSSQSIDWYKEIAEEIMSYGTGMKFRSFDDNEIEANQLLTDQTENPDSHQGEHLFVDQDSHSHSALRGHVADETDGHLNN